MYLNRDLGWARWVASQLVVKISPDPEPCMAMLLEKLRKIDRSLGDGCLCLQHTLKDQSWLLRVSGDIRPNSKVYRSNVPSVNCAHAREIALSNSV